MSTSPIIVLKFGGSVLATDADAARATHEVYRWVRDAFRVVAVVSALQGQTDQLLARAGAWTSGLPGQTPAGASATAALLATGEQQSAAILALALDRAGVPAEVLDPGALGLRTVGPALDATPMSLDARALLDALARVPVVVVPGFTGRDEHGRATLLGRGGSDLSALFIAHRLDDALARTRAGAPGGTRVGANPRVRCRLVKDVDGLYDRDPALPGPPARRFGTLSWDDALALDGTIVQHKGVRFARHARLAFEVAGLLGAGESRVGDHDATFDPAPRAPQRPLRVTILGAGTVGAGVYHAIARLSRWFELTCVVARDLQRAARDIDPALLTSDLDAALARDCDVVVELLGGLDPARDAVRAALRLGRRVVSANKAIIADAGRTPRSLTTDQARTLACSAAVGGAAPCLETARRLARDFEVRSIVGVLNGTTNVVLGRVDAGEAFEDALRLAQDAGLAEADPSRDLDGRDAGDKLVLLVREAFGAWINPDDITRVPIDADACRQPPPRPGTVLKHVARLWRRPDASLAASVAPEWVDADSPLGAARDEDNAVEFTTDAAKVTIQAKGAGRWPTTQAVVADLIDIAHEHTRARNDAHEGPRPESRRSPRVIEELADAR